MGHAPCLWLPALELLCGCLWGSPGWCEELPGCESSRTEPLPLREDSPAAAVQWAGEWPQVNSVGICGSFLKPAYESGYLFRVSQQKDTTSQVTVLNCRCTVSGYVCKSEQNTLLQTSANSLILCTTQIPCQSQHSKEHISAQMPPPFFLSNGFIVSHLFRYIIRELNGLQRRWKWE